MSNYVSKVFLAIIAASVTTVAIELIPISKQASIWNRCLKKTTYTLSNVKAVQLMDDEGKEVLAVMICNGAVFEPKIKKILK